MDKPTRRRRGRPKHSEAPDVPWDDVDHLLVHGEESTSKEGTPCVRYPSQRDLAEKYGVSEALIRRYATKHNTHDRRLAIQHGAQAVAERSIIKSYGRKLAVNLEFQLEVVDECIRNFKANLDEGKIRCDTITDLNTLLRLAQYLRGGADRRAEMNVSISLENIAERHRAARLAYESTTVAERGEIPETNATIDATTARPEHK